MLYYPKWLFVIFGYSLKAERDIDLEENENAIGVGFPPLTNLLLTDDTFYWWKKIMLA